MHGVDGRSIHRESLIMAMLLALLAGEHLRRWRPYAVCWLSALHQFCCPQTQWRNLRSRGSVDRP